MTTYIMRNEKEIKLCADVDIFVKIYSDTMKEEGWQIKQYFAYEFMIGLSDDLNDKYAIYDNISEKFNEILNIVKEYGWVVNPSGYIIEYDETKHIRNKHLMIGNKLGLL